MQKFGTILDRDWIYYDHDPPNKYPKNLKMEMRARILGKLTLLCDAGYRHILSVAICKNRLVSVVRAITHFEQVKNTLRYHVGEPNLQLLMPAKITRPVKEDTRRITTRGTCNAFYTRTVGKLGLAEVCG